MNNMSCNYINAFNFDMQRTCSVVIKKNAQKKCVYCCHYTSVWVPSLICVGAICTLPHQILLGCANTGFCLFLAWRAAWWAHSCRDEQADRTTRVSDGLLGDTVVDLKARVVRIQPRSLICASSLRLHNGHLTHLCCWSVYKDKTRSPVSFSYTPHTHRG